MSDHKFKAWKEDLVARVKAYAATVASREDAALTKAALDPGKALAYAFTMRWPGHPPGDTPKVQVSIRLSADLLDYFLSGGPGWQNRIEEILRAATGVKNEHDNTLY
ncbi:BrnA antitoxin family protein [Phyllobacterium sp. LjRoot231]|uniref:BrnA antitoxin family protein n=1 Tax=Phyllobacterium sp. LjRoot231 TaxID=3342289 RepID=UPI003ED0B477